MRRPCLLVESLGNSPNSKLTGGFCFYITVPIQTVERKCFYLKNKWQKAAKQKRILIIESINLKEKSYLYSIKIYSQDKIKQDEKVKRYLHISLNSYYIQSLHIDSVV